MRFRLICFDLDGTILDNETIWSDMHSAFNTDQKKRKRAMERFHNKEISYQEWASHDIEMFKEKDITKNDVIEFARTIRLIPGAVETLRLLKQKGCKLAIISGSVDTVLKTIMPDCDGIFDDIFINRFVFDDGGRLVRCEATDFDMEHKAAALKKIAEREKIAQEDCVFVGDNFNDIGAASHAGFSIAFNSKSDRLNQVCDVVIKEKDLRNILEYL